MGLFAKKGDCILILCECEKATRGSKTPNPEAPPEFELALYNFLHMEFGLFDFKQGKNVCKTIAFQVIKACVYCYFLRAELNGYHHQTKSYMHWSFVNCFSLQKAVKIGQA